MQSPPSSMSELYLHSFMRGEVCSVANAVWCAVVVWCLPGVGRFEWWSAGAVAGRCELSVTGGPGATDAVDLSQP